MTPETVSPELFAHDPVRLLSAADFKRRHDLETHTKARRKIASQEKTLRKVPIGFRNHSHIDERLTSSHGYHPLSGRTSDFSRVDKHKISEPLQLNPRPGLKYIGALGQERHVSCVLPVQRRFLSSLTDSTILKGKGKQSFRQENAPLSPERQVRDFDQQDANTIPRFPPYSAGESLQSVTREKLRHCMRRVPQSVAIITARDMNDLQNAWRGATVSSFTTVTFEPEVIVSLNLRLPSTTYDAILTSNRFDVNMLKASGRGAELASCFASPLEEARRKAFAMERRPQSSSLTFHPLFSRSHGVQNPVAFRIPCCYMPEKTVQIGDHVVIYGKAEAIARKSYDLRAGETTTCLAYIDGCYGYVEPLSKQLKRESTGLSSNKNRDAPGRIAKQSLISRKDFLAFANHAQECANCFKRSFFSEVHLGRIRRRTLLLVREVRLHGAEVHCAILRLSMAAKGSSTLLQNRSSLLTEIHRLLAFYFIFCSSRHLPREDFPYLPESVEGHREVFTGHLFEIESSIKTIHNKLDFTVIPNPHPLYALRKAPRRMDLALQYVQNYAEWFIAGGQFEIDSRECWCKQTYHTLVHPYIVRMRLMKMWLRHLWLSETSRSSLSLIDSLLGVPTCYLVLVRNWLVLCADQMILPLALLNAVRKVRHESLNQSLLHYNEFCKSLWRGLDRMKLFSRHRTIPAIMAHWKHLDTLHQFRRPEVSMDFNIAGHEIAIKAASMEKEMECAEVTKQEEEAQKRDTENEDASTRMLDEARKGDLADLQIVPKDGIEDLVMDPSTSVHERPSILSENDKSYMLTGASCPSANGPLDHMRSKTRKSKLAVHFVPTPMMPSLSPPITPFREFSSTRTISESVKDINHSGRSSKSSNSIELSMKQMARGALRLPVPKSMKTFLAQHMESVSVTAASADGGKLDESVMNTDPTNTVENHVSVKLVMGKRIRKIKNYPLIRPGFVDYPPFRKFFTNEAATPRTEPLAGHQQVCLRSRKKHRNRISNRDRVEISTSAKRVFIRKHLAHDKRSLPLLASPNQAQSSSGTTAEHAEDIETPIKVLFYRLALGIRKQLTINKWDDHSDVPFSSHMLEVLDQVQRENIESVMQETSVGQQTPGQVVPEEIAFRQHKKMQKLARSQTMERDIEDVMGQIQDYLQQEFGTAAVLRENIESAMQENLIGQQTPRQVLLEKIAFRQHKRMQKLARNKAMEHDIEDVMGQIQDYFQRRSGTPAA